MSLFMSACQGIGLALAAGAVAGALAREGLVATVLLAAGLAAGAAAFALTLSGNDHAAWPGIPAGALVAWVGFQVARTVASGALTRAAASGDGGGSPAAIVATVVVAALAIAALATLVPPVSLALLAAFAWMAVGQRRRASRKYEGLRVLR